MREVEVKGQPVSGGGWKMIYSDGLTDEEADVLVRYFEANPHNGKGFRLTIRSEENPPLCKTCAIAGRVYCPHRK